MDQLDAYVQQRLSPRERRPANMAPANAYHPLDSDTVFRPLPRDAVHAFTGRHAAAANRFAILLPTEATDLHKAVNLAVILGRSLHYLPEFIARDELVIDLADNTSHLAFCDLIMPGEVNCSRTHGHPGRCEKL
ncbi:hypothetical protein [Micromonospora sp. WMMD1082]|uniref:hypothetical protein n=1 Tax=Micromonospora sp. WMMD1082 TaxID=3016104 RepID=UPI0024178F91|nr:hypothetical protein [Micromonospora sp. WMMD1082]MDG4794460.1 hypothetical protein [Micromonospora sp. WMMD1082]